MKLIISEKAIAGQNIATILAGKNISSSPLGSAQVFRFIWNGKNSIVVPLRGHIVDVEFPKKYSSWMGTSLNELTDAPIDYVGTEKAIIAALKSAANECDEVIIATDADREGESIGIEALNFIKESNPKIKIKRAYFSAITKKDLDDAFTNLREVDYNYANSADSRREIDLIWGAVLTRFLSIVSGRMGKEYLSVGRVQTPVLAIIVNKEKERLVFKTQKYWEYFVLLEKDSKKFEAAHKEGKFWSKEVPESFFKEPPKTATVVGLKKSKKVLKKPTPFNTTDFLRQATSIGFSAASAMEIAEYLYQQGYTSYPRTDNTVYPPTFNLREILSETKKVTEFKADSEYFLAKKQLIASRGKKETKDHPPLHPVSAAPKEKLSDRQWKIYELIVRRFFATLADDAITENTSVDIDIANQPFVANGRIIIEPGWKKFYPYSQLNEVILPALMQGDIVNVLSLDLQEKQTEPPQRYSESSLLKLMEELNLGTKSTRHTIIQKLYARNYIVGSKSIEPSKVAFAVVDSLEKNQVDAVKPDMTAKLEEEMELVAEGKKSKSEVVGNSRLFLHKVLERMQQNREKIGFEIKSSLALDSTLAKCPKCGSNLRIIWSKNKKRFVGCSNYPKCTNTYPLPQKGKIIATSKNCKECGAPIIGFFAGRRKLEMCLDMNCKTKIEWKTKLAQKEKKLEDKKTQSVNSVSKTSAPKPAKKKTESKETEEK